MYYIEWGWLFLVWNPWLIQPTSSVNNLNLMVIKYLDMYYKSHAYIRVHVRELNCAIMNSFLKPFCSSDLIKSRDNEGLCDESRVFFLDSSRRLTADSLPSHVPSVNFRGIMDPVSWNNLHVHVYDDEFCVHVCTSMYIYSCKLLKH